MSGSVTFENVNQVILSTLDQMHNVCLCFALLLIFLSVYRNYQQFGEFLGLKYLVGVLLALVLIVLFPVMADRLFKGMLAWGLEAGRRVEETVKVMLSVEVDGSWYEAVVVGIANLFYRGGIWIGKCIRDLMILVLCGLFLVLKTLSPIFIAMLTVPETKSIGVNFLTMTFGFVMAPLCMVFGDLTMVWTVCQIWEHTGMAAAAAGAVGVSGVASASLAILAASPPGAIVVAAGAVGAFPPQSSRAPSPASAGALHQTAPLSGRWDGVLLPVIACRWGVFYHAKSPPSRENGRYSTKIRPKWLWGSPISRRVWTSRPWARAVANTSMPQPSMEGMAFPGNRHPADQYLAAGGLFHAGQLVQKGAFAGTGRAEDAADLSPHNVQADVFQRHHCLVPQGIFLADGVYLDQGALSGAGVLQVGHLLGFAGSVYRANLGSSSTQS